MMQDVFQHLVFCFLVKKAEHRIAGGRMYATARPMFLEISHQQTAFDGADVRPWSLDAFLYPHEARRCEGGA